MSGRPVLRRRSGAVASVSEGASLDGAVPTTLAVAATNCDRQADRTTNSSVNPMVHWNKTLLECAISSIARWESTVSDFDWCIRAAGRPGIPCDPRLRRGESDLGTDGASHSIGTDSPLKTWLPRGR